MDGYLYMTSRACPQHTSKTEADNNKWSEYTTRNNTKIIINVQTTNICIKQYMR